MKKIRKYFHKLRYNLWLANQKKRLRKLGINYGQNLQLYNVNFDQLAGNLITIGDNCILTNCSILAHDDSPRMYFSYRRLGKVIIGNNCFIGLGAVILPGVTIGDNVIVGAGSIVTHDIPANTVIAGNPAKVIMTVKDYVNKIQTELNFVPIVDNIDNLIDKKIDKRFYSKANV
ncbi:DapH/DapD/GlmU-related protein [Lactobacillus crispatus]|uniref:DapH/DapD/GlmU-related protein n=1 Tax=Lactobacillus crispatus TaxID=47770 RepID=UPI0012392560|nr:DapH/DapD/GlmU-related protein [Lactobacillus crispatus]KAA8810661.1 acyltransferase [Lactobacillus crispatus]